MDSSLLFMFMSPFLITVQTAWGPMARDMESISIASRILLDGIAANKVDPLTAPVPFDEEVRK